MKRPNGLVAVTLLLLVFALVEARPATAQGRRGTLTYSNASYKGEIRNGTEHGRGTMSWDNGQRYEGDWRDGKMHGHGIYTWPNGNRYEGDWRNNQRTGRGTFTWPSGHRYEGQWRNGQRTGQGTYTWPEGDRYVGEFRNGKLHGRGTYTYADGTRQVGEWRDGKRVQSQQQRQRQALREQIFDNPNPARPSYAIAGDNAGLQYWMDASGAVSQSLYEKADGTERVRIHYNKATGAPRTVRNEVSGHRLAIREAGPNRVDFWAYDGAGGYLGGFAIYGQHSRYYTGEIVRGDPRSRLTNIRAAAPELAELMDGLESPSLHSALTQGGLAALATGAVLLAVTGGRSAMANLSTAAASAFLSAQVLPHYAEGIRVSLGRGCPSAGAFGRTCADLTNLAADHLSRQKAGPIAYVRDAMDWIKNAPNRLRGKVNRGRQALQDMFKGLFAGDTSLPGRTKYIGEDCNQYKKNRSCPKCSRRGYTCSRYTCGRYTCGRNDAACIAEQDAQQKACIAEQDARQKACEAGNTRRYNECLAEYNACVGEEYIACKEANETVVQ